MSVYDSCFLLTYWGTLVCLDMECGILTHRDLLKLDERYPPAKFSLCGLTLQSILSPLDRFQITHAPDEELVFLQHNGLFVCALIDGELEASRSSASDWESFVILPSYQLDVILFLLRHDWIENSSGKLLRSVHNRVVPKFLMQLGTLNFDLLQNLPILLIKNSWQCEYDRKKSGFSSCVLWVEKWKPVQLTLFRPLIFYCAFGKDVLAQLSESVRSLAKLGNFKGDLLILSDLMRGEVEHYTHGWPPHRLHVMTVRAYDKLDFCSARYRIVDWEFASWFQPLLYVDTDVVFDLDPEKMLLKLVAASKMSAQREQGNFLSSHAPVGADLLQATSIAVCKEEGFNSGIIGIPNISEHRFTLTQIHDTIYRYVSALENRYSLSHFDQPVANFIGFITGAFDLEIITTFVRWMHTNTIHGGSESLGLVHFWGSMDKTGDMRRYADKLLNMRE